MPNLRFSTSFLYARNDKLLEVSFRPTCLRVAAMAKQGVEESFLFLGRLYSEATDFYYLQPINTYPNSYSSYDV